MSGSLLMITPAACTPHWRFRFSSPRAVSTTRLTSGSDSYSWRNSPASEYRSLFLSKTPVSEIYFPNTDGGMALVTRSPSAYG
jgi:hypothetical protein